VIDLESVACFIAAAKTLNFRVASKTRALSPAAFGKRIQQLEDELGVVLFQRTTRRIELTAAGHALVSCAQRLLSTADECRDIARSGTKPAVELTLGTRHELGMSWLLPIRALLPERLPGLALNLYFGASSDLERSLLDLVIDCAVSSRAPSTRRLDTLFLHPEEYTFVGAPKLLAARPFDEPGHALRHTLIDINETLPLFRYVEQSAGELLRFRSVAYLGTIAAIRAAMLPDEGVAVLPSYFVEPDLVAETLIRVLPMWPIQCDYFRLIFRTDDPRREHFEALAELLKSQPLS